jgi:MoaA/NifB/PqqE/SkfB family radical SAM enzyme
MDVVKEKTTSKILPYIKAIENGWINAPLSLHILLTDSCVNKCNMCDHWKTENKKHLSLDAIKELWTEMNYYGGESICLTGGDPILHPNFEEILSLKRKFELGIICTGNFKNDFDFNLLKGLSWLRFSIDSLNSLKYKMIRGLDNLRSRILPNVIKSKDYVEKVGINFTIQKMNADEITEIIGFCVENGIYRLMLYPMHGDGQLCIGEEETIKILMQLTEIFAKGYHQQIPENNFQFLYESLKQSLEDNLDVRKVLYNNLPCMINKIHLAIGSDGNVFPCETCADDTDAYGERVMWIDKVQIIDGSYKEDKEKTPINRLGNIYERRMVDIWKENYYLSYRCEKCNRCFSRYQPIIETYHKATGKKVFI